MHLELKGRMKNLTVDESGVHIQYSKIVAKGKKTIPISQIVAVEVKKPGMLNGYIYFQTIGSTGTRSIATDIMADDNSVIFNSKGKYEIALQIKQFIEAQMNAPKTTIIQNNVSVSDEILKLKNLLDVGAITQEEFDAKKKQLLNL